MERRAAAVAAVVGACLAQVRACERYAAVAVARVAHGWQLTAAGGLGVGVRAEAHQRAHAAAYLAGHEHWAGPTIEVTAAAVRQLTARIRWAAARAAARVLMAALAAAIRCGP